MNFSPQIHYSPTQIDCNKNSYSFQTHVIHFKTAIIPRKQIKSFYVWHDIKISAPDHHISPKREKYQNYQDITIKSTRISPKSTRISPKLPGYHHQNTGNSIDKFGQNTSCCPQHSSVPAKFHQKVSYHLAA
jgi:hypothetical protein